MLKVVFKKVQTFFDIEKFHAFIENNEPKTFAFFVLINMHIHFFICFVLILIQKNMLNYYLSTKPGNNFIFNTTTNVL